MKIFNITITKAFYTLFFIFVLNCFAVNSYSQTVRLKMSVDSQNLKTAITKIKQQTTYDFIYSKDIESLYQHTTPVAVENGTLEDVLNQLFKNNPIEYQVVDKTIVLTPAKQAANTSQSQEITITGTVSDKEGSMAGVNITEKGSKNATISDTNGKYSLKVSGENAILVFSFIGYDSVEKTVGSQAVINANLNEGGLQINEVVVTALGIKREAKALTYNVQEIKSDEVTRIADANFINNLAGKVAGITINNSSSGIGGSTRVIMRGSKSLFGNNNALYVVDGILLPSLKTAQSNDFYRVPDGGDNEGISHLNPEDIENISVLTGPAAAALYGSQGANGVVLITTRQGNPGKLRVAYSNHTTFISPFVTPRFQNTYGSEEGNYQSWGNKLETPSSYDPLDFFQTGYNETNSVNLSTGTEKNSTYASVSTVNSRGIVPNNEYNRYNIYFRNTSALIDQKLLLDLSAFYMNQDDQNMRGQGQYHNPLLPIYLFPRSDDIEKYKLYERYNVVRNFNTQYWPYGNLGLGVQNPYWINNRSMFNNERQRYMFNSTLKYTILPWINITGRLRIDNTETNYDKKFYATSDGIFAAENGFYMNQKTNTKQTYADAILNIDKAINDHFRIIANLGASVIDTKYGLSGYEGNLFAVPNFFHYSNINRTDANKTKNTQDAYHDQIQAVFATAQLGFNNFLFLDITGRNDWPSMLYGTTNSSYFYPSVGLSGVVSDLVDLSPVGISFLKARFSYSEVGNPPERWIANASSYRIENGQLNMNTFPPATFLEPELTKSFETGLNIKFLKGKINLDLTYYSSDTYNQRFVFTPPPSTGYTSMYLNAGQVNNYGLEATLAYKQNLGPVSWNSNVTFSFNRNKIKELIPPGTLINGVQVQADDRITVSSALNHAYEMVLEKGGTMSDIYVKGFAVDSKGNILVDSRTGEINSSNTPIKAGKASPDYNIGFRNSFSFKGFNLSFLLNGRIGGVVVSATQSYLDGFGVSQSSAEARDNEYVSLNGKKINVKNYYKVAGGGQVLAPYVYDASNVRLKELSLSYELPKKIFDNKISGVVLSLTAQNLWMIYNKAPYDPEITASTDTYYQGFDYFMMPSLRNIGFGVKILF